MQFQIDDKKLVYGAYGIIAFLLMVVIVQAVVIADLYLRLDKFTASTGDEISGLKTQLSGIGTIVNTHLIEYDKLREANKVRDARLDAHEAGIKAMNTTITSLESNFSEFKAKYIDLKDRYSNLLGYSETLKKGLDEFESSLMSKWQWIKGNAVIQPKDMSRISGPLDSYCGPDIKIPCIAAVLQLKEGFGYISDYGDQIKSVSDFINDKGGDCEDWSLFMKSYINSQRDGKMIRAFATGGDDDYEIFQDGSDIYYYSNARDVKIGKKGTLECIVICHDMGDYGHCVLAFASREANVSIFDRINGAQAVEPQNGQLIGEVERDDNDSSKFYLKVSKTTYKLPIYILVTDNDLYLYDDGVWSSYGSQFEKLEQIKNP
ncbi:MAG: hypothetical protein QW500_03750 [Candidatus Micrarchaeia archaeon]